jgi:hypothetical protein
MNEKGSHGVDQVTYSRPVGSAATESFEIVAEGESTLTLTFNHDERQEIGVWSHALPKERFEELVRRLHASGYERLPPATELVPGMVPEVFGERRAAEKKPTTRAFLPTPPELQDVTTFLRTLGTELRAHPSRVLRGEARWQEEGLTKGCDVEIDVTLTNVGVLPLQISNPLHGPASEWSGLRLTFRREGVGEESFDLRPTDVRMGAGTPTTRTLRLAPSQALSFAVCTAMPVGRGTYAARLQLHGMVPGSKSRPEIIDGMLWLLLGEVSVAGRP